MAFLFEKGGGGKGGGRGGKGGGVTGMFGILRYDYISDVCFCIFRYVVAIVFCIEHFLILCAVFSRCLVSEKPKWVRIAIAKEEYEKGQETMKRKDKRE